MPRLLRPLTFALAGLALALAGCRTSTPYTAMYSPRKSHFVAPVPKAEKSAEELLKVTEASQPAGAPGTLGGLPPAEGSGVPGLPPAAAPAADPLAPPPAPAPAN